jgi:eukaryotic translation initiation factor 2C
VKSTHYTVVYDENQLTPDEIQKGTHDASHLYARATKAVSLIPAAYYADLACERGRCYLNDFLVDDKASTAGGSGRADKDAEKARVFNAAREAWGQGVSLSLLICTTDLFADFALIFQLHPDMRETMFYI